MWIRHEPYTLNPQSANLTEPSNSELSSAKSGFLKYFYKPAHHPVTPRSRTLIIIITNFPLYCTHMSTFNGVIKLRSQIYCCHGRVALSKAYNYQVRQLSLNPKLETRKWSERLPPGGRGTRQFRVSAHAWISDPRVMENLY